MQEQIFIIQPILSDDYEVIHSEAIALIKSAGGFYVGSSFQTVKEINAATFIGKGKLAEIAEKLGDDEQLTVLFNGDLSPSQLLNISSALGGRKVIDRTTLILDIFARNAVTNEGKIQVEMAQLKYVYPRLKGKGAALSRLGGGIGSRGPGETKLETDRRRIAQRLKLLERKLKETESRRSLLTSRRAKNDVKVIALVGYTNTGKSTLLNYLTDAEVVSKDALFVTLDPTARKFTVDGEEYLLIDTVGFIRNLPHNIVEAFKSTLEAALYCDLALFVADATADYERQFEITAETLGELGFDKKFIKVLNKCDNLSSTENLPADCVAISARTGAGVTELKRTVRESFSELFATVKLLIPFDKVGDYEKLRRYCTELSRAFNDDGIEVEIKTEKKYAAKFNAFRRSYPHH